MSYDKYMDIHAPEGTKVKFTANGGMDGEIRYAKKKLIVGEIYTVRKTVVHDFSTSVYLEEFPNESFNSCLFDAYLSKPSSKLDTVCKKAIKKWGKDAELIMVFEEMSELGVEIAKGMRQGVHNDPDAFSGSRLRIADEVADVEIMLHQVKLIFDISDTVNKIKVNKIERMEKRLE